MQSLHNAECREEYPLISLTPVPYSSLHNAECREEYLESGGTVGDYRVDLHLLNCRTPGKSDCFEGVQLHWLGSSG